MEVKIINCPSCGEETFNNNFCIFCGRTIETTKEQRDTAVPQNEEEINRFGINILHEKLKIVLELKSKFEEELGDLNDTFVKYKNETEKYLANLEKDKDDAKKKLEELTVLYKLEELSEKNYKEQTEVLAQRIRHDEQEIKDAQSGLKELKKIKHKIRKLNSKKTTNKKSSRKKRIKEKLTDLELAYKNKKISNELYAQLKTKYEKQLKK